MKLYQVTRKFQVTIPKKIAEKAGIRPGDSVTFEERQEGIFIKKSGETKTQNQEELRTVIKNFVVDISKVKPHIKKARAGLNENLSRNIRAK